MGTVEWIMLAAICTLAGVVIGMLVASYIIGGRHGH